MKNKTSFNTSDESFNSLKIDQKNFNANLNDGELKQTTTEYENHLRDSLIKAFHIANIEIEIADNQFLFINNRAFKKYLSENCRHDLLPQYDEFCGTDKFFICRPDLYLPNIGYVIELKGGIYKEEKKSKKHEYKVLAYEFIGLLELSIENSEVYNFEQRARYIKIIKELCARRKTELEKKRIKRAKKNLSNNRKKYRELIRSRPPEKIIISYSDLISTKKVKRNKNSKYCSKIFRKYCGISYFIKAHQK